MKEFFSQYIGSIYLTRRFFALAVVCTALFVLRFFLTPLGLVPYFTLLAFLLASILDFAKLFTRNDGVFAQRSHAERFSNGDDNEITIGLESRYSFPVRLEIIDEIPVQFQRRDILFRLLLKPGERKVLAYRLRPLHRGSFGFGLIRVFVRTEIGLLTRRYSLGRPADVSVYPSYLQLRKYQLMAISNRLSEAGLKKLRRIGHSMEFEQIREYVKGDDYRTINWKATARKGALMTNNYSEEKSQQIYCVLDKGRVMKMPFEGLSLLDYSINTSLVLSNVALIRQDKAGIISFAENISSFLPAEKNNAQMQAILEVLYNQKTRYLESDFERLYIFLRRKVTQRSLIVLFTNFESLNSMRRQLPYLKKIAENHLLLTVFFENSELAAMLEAPAENLKAVYTKTIAEKFNLEKKLIVKELNRQGILSVLTGPKQLTVNALNKYLEIKARQLL